MKRLYLLLIVVLLPSSLWAREEMKLIIGYSQSLETDYEIGDIAISNSEICSYLVRESRKEVYLNPTKEGIATLTLWDKEGVRKEVVQIEVLASDIHATLEKARQFQTKIPSLKIEQEGSKVILSGEVHTPAQLADVQAFAAQDPAIESRAQLSEMALNTIAKRIEKAIQTPGITARAVRGKLLLEGLTYSQDIYKKIDTIAKLYDSEIINLIEVRQTNRRPGYDKTIKLDIFFMEIKNSAVKSFGIQWAPGSFLKNSGNGQDAMGLGGGLQTLLGFVTSLLPKIRWIHEKNLGRILEKPTFLVKSGETVNFYSGTQVPYFAENQVTFKEVGVRIEAEPIASQQDVDLQVKVNVSALSSSVDQGIDTHEISTNLFVKSNQAAVLGGLLRKADVRSYNKVPKNLDTTTALFTLFLSKDFQKNESQFYIFLLPQILEQPTPAEEKLKKWLEIHKEMN